MSKADFMKRLTRAGAEIQVLTDARKPVDPPGMGKVMMLFIAWFLGEMQPDEGLAAGYQRGLGWPNGAALKHALMTNSAEMQERHADAVKRLFRDAGVDVQAAPEKLAEDLHRLYAAIPLNVRIKVGLPPSLDEIRLA